MFTLKPVSSFSPSDYPGVTIYLKPKTVATRTQLNKLLVPYQQRYMELLIDEEKVRDNELKNVRADKDTVKDKGVSKVSTPFRIDSQPLVDEETNTPTTTPTPTPTPTPAHTPTPTEPEDSIPNLSLSGLLPSENDVFTPHPPAPLPPPRAEVTSKEGKVALNTILRAAQNAVAELVYPATIRTFVSRVSGLSVDLDDGNPSLSLTTAEDLLKYAPEDLIESIVVFIDSTPNGLNQEEKLNLEQRSTSV